MRNKFIKITLYLLIVFSVSQFVVAKDVRADICPGTAVNTCTKVDSATCTTTDKSYIPDHVSKYACEICNNDLVTVKHVGPIWINYPESGVANSADPYVNIPSALYPSYLPVHTYASRLGCWGPDSDKLASIAVNTTNKAVGLMSLLPSYTMTIDDFTGTNRGYQMNLKLAEYAQNYSARRDPILEMPSSLTLQTFRLLKQPGENVWLDLVNVSIARDNPFGRYYLQYPGSYMGAQINLIEVNNRCNASNQFDDDNYCDLDVYIGASAIDGYALLDNKSTLKIKRALPPAAVTFTGNVTSNVSTAKIGDSLTFTHSMGASYVGDVKNARADYAFSGNPISAPSGPRVIGPINYFNANITSQSASAIETHKVTLADAQRGYVCRTISWTSSATTPVPTNNPAGRSVQRCVTITPPSMTVSGTLDSDIAEASLSKAITLTSKPNVTYSYAANSPVTYTLRTTSSAASTALKSWTTTPGVQQTAFTSPTPTYGPFLPTLAEAVAGQACRYLHWSYADPLTGAATAGFTPKCVPVTYNYELTPSVKVPSSAEPGATITPDPLVTRDGDLLSSNSDWTLTSVILPASNKTNFGSAPVVNSSSPAAHYNSLTGVASVTHASGSNIFSNRDTHLLVSGFDLDPTLQIGQRVCFGLSVKPYINTSSTNYKHSALDCVTISKSPSAQIHGGGLLVANGKVVGGSSRQHSTNKSFGSWAEYDITANGTVDKMVASAMGYGLDGKTPDPDSKNLQKLTFANTPSYGSFGAANTLSHSLVTGGLTNPYKFFVDSAVNLSASTGALTVTPSGLGSTYGETKVYKHSSDITLNASTLPLGKQIVLIAENSNIYINGNQTYTNLINGPKSLPQLVLIAHNGNIIINESVTNVDAWLIASSETDDKKGQLWTCHIKPDNSAQCDDQLVVNGPVMVDYLRLYRIYGSDYGQPLGFRSGGLNDPAEIFNLRPDAYIWSLQNSQSNTILKTTHIKDLAPRY